MKRTKVGILWVVLLALLAVGIPVVAQQTTPPQKSATPKDTSDPWQPVADGIWKASISRFPSTKGVPQGPEFAVLRVSAKHYQEFKTNPKDFLNDHKTFSANVNKVVFFKEAAPQTRTATDDYWYVVTSHWPPSSAACVAYSEWSEPAGSNPPVSKPAPPKQ